MNRKFYLTLFAFVILSVPFAAHAAFGTLIPTECNCDQPYSVNGVDTISSAPAWGCVFATFQNALTMAFQLATVLISIFLALAGFTYMTSGGSAEKRQLANKRLMNVVIGLLIVLGSYLLVDSLMKVIYNAGATDGTTKFGPWNAILASGGPQCLAPTQPPKALPALTGAIAGSNAGGGDGSGSAQLTAVPASTASGNEGAVRAQFSAAGVSVNHEACTGSSGSGCTDVGGMQQATIQQVINLSNKCGGSGGCGMTVTGGNEPGHAAGTYSHGNGYKVDLRLGTAMDGVIQSLKKVADRTGDSPGSTWIDSCNNQYVEESDHWDVTVYAACSL